MSEYSFKENEYLVVGWAQGLMDTEEEDANGKKVNVQRPYYQLFVLSPVSSYKSDTYRLRPEGAEAQMRLGCRVEEHQSDGGLQSLL